MATDGLAKANARRHQSAVVAAQGAIERLCREGAAVNFAAVSRAAGVSRTWLYREAELYDSIGRLRSSAPQHRGPRSHSERAPARSANA